MENQFTHVYVVGNMPFAVALSASLQQALQARLTNYALFLVDTTNPSAATPAFHLEVYNDRPPFEVGDEDVYHIPYDEGSFRVFSVSEGYVVAYYSPNGDIVSQLYVSLDYTRSELRLFGPRELCTFAFDNGVMMSYAFAGARQGRMLVHAATVVLDGASYLFLGKSGTGKSTHARLWLRNFAGAWLLNDDNPVLEVTAEGNVITHGTPWSGKTPCYIQASAPTGGIVRLEQSPHNAIRQEKGVEGFASLLASCSCTPWDKGLYDQLVAAVAAATTRVGVYRLRCLPDDDAARLCRQTVTSNA